MGWEAHKVVLIEVTSIHVSEGPESFIYLFCKECQDVTKYGVETKEG